MIKSILLVIATVATNAVWADDSSYVITYSQKELSTAAGVAAVHDRLVQAGRDYCPTYLQMKSHSAVQACVDSVVEDLLQKINQPMLTAYAEDPEQFVRNAQMIAAKGK